MRVKLLKFDFGIFIVYCPILRALLDKKRSGADERAEIGIGELKKLA